MRQKTINDFIKELQSISADKRELPLIIQCPNGLEVYPSIKMKFENLEVFLSQGMSYSEWKKLTYGGKPAIEL